MSQNLLRRVVTPEVKILSSKDRTVEYVVSDASLDSYREVVMPSGARFDLFKKNAPFVDSHNYESIDRLLGKVLDWRVEDNARVVETVQWAADVAGADLARIGWAMTEAGFLKAVSIGFFPVRMVSKYSMGDSEWAATLATHGLPEATRAVHLEWQQIELSAVIIGANPNALARAYKAGALSDDDLDKLSAASAAHSPRQASRGADADALAHVHRQRGLLAVVLELTKNI